MMMMRGTVDHKRRSHDSFILSNLSVENSKRLKVGGGTSLISAKEKERIGERVASLQQLVSPFGKSDTASVLEEATGYIRFLHDQLQVLSAPYLLTTTIGGMQDPQESYNLRGRGLCLAPVALAITIAGSNGADIWAPSIATRRPKPPSATNYAPGFTS